MKQHSQQSFSQKEVSAKHNPGKPSEKEPSSKEILILGASLMVLTLGIGGMWMVSENEPSPANASKPADIRQVSQAFQSSSQSDETTDMSQSIPEENRMLASLEQEVPVSESVSPLQESDVYFKFDQATLSDEAKGVIQTQISPITDQQSIKITVQGHTDQRGTETYNQALGLRRAEAVKAYLVAEGFNEESIEIESFGSHINVCVEESEDCFRQNRRAHLIMNTEELTAASETPSLLETAELLTEEPVQENVDVSNDTSSDEETSTTTAMLSEELDTSSTSPSPEQEATQP